MKTFKTALGFEYDLEVISVTRDSIDYVVTCDEGEIEFINEPFDMSFAERADIALYNEGQLDRDELIESIQQFDEIETVVNEMILAARN